MSVSRLSALVTCFGCACLAGCNSEPGPIEKVATAPALQEDSRSAPDQTEPPIEPDSQAAGVHASGTGLVAIELSESGIRCEVPADWKKVPPQNNIVEAEFELPRVEGDDFDGRLTLMSASGDPEQTIATRKAEFDPEPGETPEQKRLQVAGVEATLVDLRGVWRGMSERKMAPRPGYRMLLVIVPLAHSTFYVKLTGPRATLAARDDEFQTFLRSLRTMR